MQLLSVEVGSVNPVKPCPKPINRVLEYEYHVPVDKKRDDRHYSKPISCKIGSLKELSRDYENCRIYQQGVICRDPLLSVQNDCIVDRLLVGSLYTTGICRTALAIGRS